MKVLTYFKLLKRKIDKYDRLASNPFTRTREEVTIIWVEDFEKKSDNKN